MRPVDISSDAADQGGGVDAAGGSYGATTPRSSGFMGMMGGVGNAAHKGSPDKAAEMLSMQQSPTAEKVNYTRHQRTVAASVVPSTTTSAGLHPGTFASMTLMMSA